MEGEFVGCYCGGRNSVAYLSIIFENEFGSLVGCISYGKVAMTKTVNDIDNDAGAVESFFS